MGVRELVPSDFGRSAAMIWKENRPLPSNMTTPLPLGPHRWCFVPSSVWSYTESNSQVPTISSLSVFCWPSASAERKGNSEAQERQSGHSECGTLVHCVHRFMVRFPVFVCRPNDLLRDFSGSGKRPCREGSEECLSKRRLSDSRKERPGLFGVNENVCCMLVAETVRSFATNCAD
jgi:hypothetical protein